jgi:hypothetical protein
MLHRLFLVLAGLAAAAPADRISPARDGPKRREGRTSRSRGSHTGKRPDRRLAASTGHTHSLPHTLTHRSASGPARCRLPEREEKLPETDRRRLQQQSSAAIVRHAFLTSQALAPLPALLRWRCLLCWSDEQIRSPQQLASSIATRAQERAHLLRTTTRVEPPACNGSGRFVWGADRGVSSVPLIRIPVSIAPRQRASASIRRHHHR